MANLREADVLMSRVLRGFLLVFPGLVTLPFAALAVLSPKPDERWFSAFAAFVLGGLWAVLWIAIPRIAMLRGHDERVESAIAALHAELGGATLLPSPRLPVVQPRLLTSVEGREVEVRCYRRPGTPDAEAWEVLVMVAGPAPFRWAVVGDGFALDARAGLTGLSRVDVAVPAGLAALSDDPPRAAATLAAPAVADALARLAALLPTFAIERSPAGALTLGTVWRAGFVPGEDLAAAVRAALPLLLALASDDARS